MPGARKPSEPSARIGRRDLLQTLATGLAGAVSAPAALERGQEREPSSAGTVDAIPRLLDDPRRRTLGVLADLLVPGSTAAGVVDLLDRVMAVEPVEDQKRFLSALGAFEREARDRHARSFLDLEASQQHEILQAASTVPPAQPAPPPWTKGQPIARESAPLPPANLRDHFDHLRALVARAYYTTEPGMKELGFTGRMSFPTLPGCAHSGTEHG